MIIEYRSVTRVWQLARLLTRGLAVSRRQPEPSLGENLEPSLGENLEPSLGDSLEPSLGDDLEPSLGESWPEHLLQLWRQLSSVASEALVHSKPTFSLTILRCV